MYPMKNVQAVLLISANVELCIWISTSGEGFHNFFRSNLYSNRTLPFTSCDCIYAAVYHNGIDQVENEFVTTLFQDISRHQWRWRANLYTFTLFWGMFIQVFA